MASKKKKPENIYLRALSKTWTDFTIASSVHGLKYITDSTGNKMSKTIWLVITMISFVIANTLVFTFYSDFISNPTRLNIETDHAPISEIFFPAITVCSTNYISFLKTAAFIKGLKLPPNTTEEMVYNYFRQSTGFRMKSDYSEDDLNELQRIIDDNRYSIADTMFRLRIDCKQLLFRCRWQSETIDCLKLFQLSRTYSGACCSFNLKQKGIRFDRKYATMHGASAGLSIIATPIFDDAAITSTYSHGVKLLVHKNNVFPSETTIEKLIPIYSEVLVRIRPTVITCSDQVQQLGIEERNCLFPEERQLRFFPEYDDENCVVECQILSIIERCDCVPYYFLQEENIPVCNFTKIPCLVENFDRTIVRKESADYKCDCPESCQTTTFDVQTNAVPFTISNYSVSRFYRDLPKTSTIVHIFLNSQVYKRLRRDLLTNFIALISNFGSAYSLFIGMSIISVIELFYFFTFVFNRNIKQMQENDNQVALFTKRLEKIDFKAWKVERSNQTPVLNIFN